VNTVPDVGDKDWLIHMGRLLLCPTLD